ncbi:MAG: esterase-like activity of phytase family protein [Novosphingobium sp.]
MKLSAACGMVGALAVLAGCAPVEGMPQAPRPTPSAVRLIGRTVLPTGAATDTMPVGGISGIDYDAGQQRWFMISDDRSQQGPARFWELRIDYDIDRAPTAQALAARRLQTQAGAAFPQPGLGEEAADAESLRASPLDGLLIWSSEGDARDEYGPAVRRMETSGSPRGAVPLPGILKAGDDGHSGPRPNLSIEGLAFAPGGRSLWISMEAPLLQDGLPPNAHDGARVRLSRLAYPSGDLLAQYAYPLDPIGPFPAGRLADNGVSEILALGKDHLLVLERSGIQQADGDFRYRVRLYCAAVAGASDIGKLASLRGAAITAMRKSLVVDLAQVLPGDVDNVEGMTFGPVLGNGHSSLVLVTDNNFSPRHASQVIALEILSRRNQTTMIRALCSP